MNVSIINTAPCYLKDCQIVDQALNNSISSTPLMDWRIQNKKELPVQPRRYLKRKKLTWLISLLFPFAALTGMAAQAADIPLLNSNYESDIVPHDTGKTRFISGWVNSGFGSVGVAIPKGNGEEFDSLNNQGQVAYVNAGGRFSQLVPVDLLLGETYTLQYDIGRPKGATGHHFVARIKADGLVVAQTQSSSDAVEEGEWRSQTLTFTATQAMPLGKKVVVEFTNLASTHLTSTDPVEEGDQTEPAEPTSTENSNIVMLDNISLSSDGAGEITVPDVEEVVVVNSVMQGDATLNIPEDFPNINAALASLNGVVIKKDSIVTIKVNNCAVNDPNASVVVDHPQGQNIHIIGDVQNPDNCQLLFYGVNGFVVNNSRLGLIDGFHIKGNENSVGIYATNLADIRVGKNTWISDFYIGIQSVNGSILNANDTVSFSHGNAGYASVQGAVLHAQRTESYGNAEEGFDAWNSGYINASSANAYNNAWRGVIAHHNSYVIANYAISRNNGQHGFGSHSFSALSAYASNSSGNNGGYYANDVGNHSSLYRDRQVTSTSSNRRVNAYFGGVWY